ncbi:dipeptidase PepE [Leptobacterium flavescens]|uniref:dipeptidase E n=1 Tax=Leptobacterium flavescens TaxID=472055 RepID=A0A6P0UPX6_9FLAO|nr:dipeptidase PepE [Leptobacterium flavescens]NER12436.1 dipeptidase PepE [Leptobacterium flavescens]
MKKIIIASTSTVHGSEYLEYIKEELFSFFENTKTIVFIPYARPGGISHDDYTATAAKAFKEMQKEVIGLHTFQDPVKAIQEADAVFTGGGNTFLLVSQLYKNGLMEVLRERVLNGLLYLGTSAGSNITGQTMQTTNDMPIIYPPSFKTLGLVPFNINPHYLDPIEGSTHMGETRETRIKEFHKFNDTVVIGLREGSWLRVDGDEIVLKGKLPARIFKAGEEAFEVPAGEQIKI